MKFGSLFAGIGGIDLGLERAGMVCIWQVENDPYAIKVLEKHWPNVHREKDVKECGKHNLETVDLIAGGFPCQPHSVAGKRRGKGDDRNLWPEFSRIIAELRPRYVLAENVPGIITTYLDEVLSDLEGKGYTCGTFDIPACAFDAPHRRQRIFVVAHTKRIGRRGRSDEDGQTKRRPLQTQRPSAGNQSRILDWNPNGGNGDEGSINKVAKGKDTESAGICESLSDPQIKNDGGSSPEQMRGQAQQSGVGTVEGDVADTEQQYGDNGGSGASEVCGKRSKTAILQRSEQWTVEPNVGRVAHGVPRRVDRLKCLGNAVVPQVAEYIGWRVREFNNALAKNSA